MMEKILQLSLAIRRATDEHGTPNRFSPGELEQLYGGPPAREAGIIGRWWLPELKDKTPGLVAYRKRHFVIE